MPLQQTFTLAAQKENMETFATMIERLNLQNRHETYLLHSDKFKRFWNERVCNQARLQIDEINEIVKMLDANAKGKSKGDLAVAKTYIRQNMWHRIFLSLNENLDIQNELDSILKEEDSSVLCKKITQFKQTNDKYKNGLTGKNAVPLNAILFLWNPNKFINMVSMEHRIICLKKISDTEVIGDYGTQIINSNDLLLKLYPSEKPCIVAEYLYHVNNLWRNDAIIDVTPDSKEDEKDINETVAEDPNSIDGVFGLEKHLEDFLITNWEKTELGKRFELISEDGSLVSQQFDTKEVGIIDLLVKEKVSNQYVVIELKKNQTSDQTVGQVLRYMGWVKRKLSKEQPVKGVIISSERDVRLSYAISMVSDIELIQFKVKFELLPWK